MDTIDLLVKDLSAVIKEVQASGVSLHGEHPVGTKAYGYQDRIKTESRELMFRLSDEWSFDPQMFERSADLLVQGAELMSGSTEGRFERERVGELIQRMTVSDPAYRIPARFAPYVLVPEESRR